MRDINCEMCGRNSELVKALIEGVEMDVCANCARFGNVISKPKMIEEKKMIIKRPERKVFTEEQEKESVVDNYAGIIKRKREELGLKQDELAKSIAEKESLIAKIEAGQTRPGIDLAKKLEKKLNIHLVEIQEMKKIVSSGTGSGDMTLGDIIKIKKR